MLGAFIRRHLFAYCIVVLGLTALPAPAFAQSGQVKGKVVDAQNKPIEGALVTISTTGDMNRKFEVKTNKKGEFFQIGVPSGRYQVKAEKDGMSQTFPLQVRLDMNEVNFTLKPGSAGGEVSPEDRKKMEAKVAAVKAAFEEGVTFSNAGKHDEAIAKFNEVIAQAPKCVECYTNIGAIHTRKKEYDQAEAAYKKAIEVNPSSPEAYMGLATVYNGQKKFDQAAEASAQAAKLGAAAGGTGGGNAAAVFNQGVISWNAGKIADAKKSFEEAVKIDPALAEAHYWLGMANVNEGKLPEAAQSFEQYLKLAPTGQYAEQAKGILTQIKK
jgi:cytochrome c-type biogenesis protein CcmH/NrfG